MRKGHEKILNKAIEHGFPELYINYIRDSEFTITELDNLYWFLRSRYKVMKPSTDDFKIYEIIRTKKIFKWQMSQLCYGLSKIEKDIAIKILEQNDNIINCVVDIFNNNNINLEDAIKYATEIKSADTPYTYALKFFLTFVSYETEKEKEVAANYQITNIIEFAKYASCKFDILEEEWKNRNQPQHYVIFSDNITKFYDLVTIISNVIRKGIDFKTYLLMLDAYDKIDIFVNSSKYFGKIDNNWFVYDSENTINRLEKIVKEYGIENKITMDVDTAIRSAIKISGNSLSVTFQKCPTCYCYFYLNDNDELFENYGYSASYDSEAEYVFFTDTFTLFRKNNKSSKLVRVSVKQLHKDIQKFGAAFKEFANFICDMQIFIGRYIYHDIKKMLNKPCIYIPIDLCKASEKHTIEELCKDMYKKDIPISWNKGDVSINYLTYKSYFLVREKDRGILINECRKLRAQAEIDSFYKFMEKYAKMYGCGIEHPEYTFLAFLLFRRIDANSFWVDEYGIKASEKEIYMIFEDYVRMSKDLKKKIKLSFNSAKKVRDAHDDIVIDYMIKNDRVPLIKIPSKSVFKNLRNLLPEEFEWIKTRKRIIEEGYYMRHCVASYADLINDDVCAIYSFIYKPNRKRYTIEFRYDFRNKKYLINQIQSKCNRGSSNEVRDYIKSFLNEK